MKKIIFINRMAGTFIGGGEFEDFELANFFVKKGWRVELLTATPPFTKPPTMEMSDKVKVKIIWMPYFRQYLYKKFRGNFIFVHLDAVLFDLLSVLYLLARAVRYEVIYFSGRPRSVQILKRLMPKKTIVVKYSGRPNMAQATLIQDADLVIGTGEVADFVRETFKLKTSRLLWGAKIKEFKPLKKKTSSKYKTLAFAGRLIPVKRVDRTIRLLKEIVDQSDRGYRLLIFGEGPEQSKLKLLAKKFKIDDLIDFKGFISRKALAAYYSQVDAYIQLSDYESLSQTTIQAMASGLPVIVSDGGWLPKLTAEGKCGLVVKGEVKKQARIVIKLLRNKTLLKEMGIRARNEALKNYDDDRKLNEVYINIVEKL